jgi:hypothetical protein
MESTAKKYAPFVLGAAGIGLLVYSAWPKSASAATLPPAPSPPPPEKPPVKPPPSGGGGSSTTKPPADLGKVRIVTIDKTTFTPSKFAQKWSGTASRWRELQKVNPELTLKTMPILDASGAQCIPLASEVQAILDARAQLRYQEVLTATGNASQAEYEAQLVRDNPANIQSAEQSAAAAGKCQTAETLVPWEIGQTVVLPDDWVEPASTGTAGRAGASAVEDVYLVGTGWEPLKIVGQTKRGILVEG